MKRDEIIGSIVTVLQWMWTHTYGIRSRVACTCGLGVIKVLLSLGFIIVSKRLVDAATNLHDDAIQIVNLAIVLIAIMLVEMGISLLSQYLTQQTEIKLKNQLQSGLYSHLMISQWIEHQSLHSGDLLNRLTEDVRQIADVICRRLQNVFLMVFQFVGAFTLLCFYSWRLALCVVGIMPFFLLMSKVYIKKTKLLTKEIRSKESEIQTGMQEGIQHHAVVQTMECEGMMQRQLLTLQGQLYDKNKERINFSLFSRSMVQAGFIVCYLTAFLWSIWHLHTGAITFGTMTAFLQLVSRIQNPIVNLADHVPALVHSMTSVDRLLELEDLPSETQAASQIMTAPVGIKIDNVTYRYPGGERDVFENFSYDFLPGSKTVIMGQTGIGKSTLVKLLLSLLRPQKGSIYLYDKDREIPVGPNMRCNTVYVPQGNSLFNGSIRDNLMLADAEANEQEIRNVLFLADAEFVYDLPKGLDSHCGELGVGLSEGQAQRIAIARALLRKGSVLLLDEFNSSLDQNTASTIMQRLIEYRGNETIIFISHRTEVEAYCDQCLKLGH